MARQTWIWNSVPLMSRGNGSVRGPSGKQRRIHAAVPSWSRSNRLKGQAVRASFEGELDATAAGEGEPRDAAVADDDQRVAEGVGCTPQRKVRPLPMALYSPGVSAS